MSFLCWNIQMYVILYLSVCVCMCVCVCLCVCVCVCVCKCVRDDSICERERGIKATGSLRPRQGRFTTNDKWPDASSWYVSLRHPRVSVTNCDKLWHRCVTMCDNLRPLEPSRSSILPTPLRQSLVFDSQFAGQYRCRPLDNIDTDTREKGNNHSTINGQSLNNQ